MIQTVVDLGGVGHYKNGTITVNIDQSSGADIICDITAEAKRLHEFFDPDSVNMFTCIHTIEHLEPKQALDSMAYWKEFLEPNGRLLIVTPNSAQIARDFASGTIPFEVMASLFYRNSPYSISPEWSTHRWGWSEYTLRRDMTNAGYNVIIPERSFGVPDSWAYDYEDFKFTNLIGKYMVPNLKLIGFKK